MSIVNQHLDDTLNYMHPMNFSSNFFTNDTFAIKKMLQQQNVGDFIHVMLKGIDDHETHNHWT